MQGGYPPPPGGGSGYGGPPGGAPPGGGYGPPGGYGGPPPGGPPGFAPNPYAGPGAPMGGPPMGGAQYGNYEFNDAENAVIEKTGKRVTLWGWISTVLGGLQFVGGGCGAFMNPGAVMYVPYGIVMLIVGLAFIGAGNSLQTIVRTQGNDAFHMMTALQKLGNAFFIQTITMVVGIVLAIIIAVIVFVVAAAAIAASAAH